jgi:hypothetical protein
MWTLLNSDIFPIPDAVKWLHRHDSVVRVSLEQTVMCDEKLALAPR